MCYATGELSHHLKLLRMPEHLLGFAPFGDFELEAAICFGQFSSAFGNL